MFERECRLHAFVLDYTKKLAQGIDESQMTLQPAPGMNTPLWILGHLAIASDFAATSLGLPMNCPRAWHKAFGPGSDPNAVRPPHPTKAELLQIIEANHARIAEALQSVTPEQLAQPNTFEPTTRAFPTVGDLLAHLMTTHPTMHLGQLSAWRRLQGLPAVLGF